MSSEPWTTNVATAEKSDPGIRLEHIQALYERFFKMSFPPVFYYASPAVPVWRVNEETGAIEEVILALHYIQGGAVILFHPDHLLSVQDLCEAYDIKLVKLDWVRDIEMPFPNPTLGLQPAYRIKPDAIRRAYANEEADENCRN